MLTRQDIGAWRRKKGLKVFTKRQVMESGRGFQQYGKVVNGVEVTDVRIRKVLDEGKMKAIVSVTLDDAFVVHDIKVVEGQNGLFVAMPSRRTPNGEFRDIAHPINASARARIQDAVLEAYAHRGSVEF